MLLFIFTCAPRTQVYALAFSLLIFLLPFFNHHQAPEILRLEQYDVKADLWSVGVILWEMLTGKPPFKSRTPFELPHVIENTVLRLDPALGISRDCLDLLYSLLQKDSVQRIGWEEFFLHPFLGFHQLNTPTPGTSPSSLGTSPATVGRPGTSPASVAGGAPGSKPAVVQHGFFARPPPMAAAPVRDLLGPAPSAPIPTPHDALRFSHGRERSSSNPAHLVKVFFYLNSGCSSVLARRCASSLHKCLISFLHLLRHRRSTPPACQR